MEAIMHVCHVGQPMLTNNFCSYCGAKRSRVLRDNWRAGGRQLPRVVWPVLLRIGRIIIRQLNGRYRLYLSESPDYLGMSRNEAAIFLRLIRQGKLPSNW